MYTSQGEAVREWLQAYRKMEDEIDDRLDAIRELRGRIMGIKAQEITDMPRCPGSTDPMEEYIIRLERMEGNLEYLMREHERDRRALVGIVKIIPDKEEQSVIRMRYLYGMEWNKIQSEVYKDMGDSERRRMYRDHESALEWMGKNW